MNQQAVAGDGLDRPIFILGPHRSGTTMLYNILARHPEVGYLNKANRRMIHHPRLAHWVTRLGVADEPREAQKTWDHFHRGGSNANAASDVMTAAQATAEVRDWYLPRIRRVLALRGVTRFVAKYPRLTLRVEWLNAMFPEALFLHLVRDWRAVVNSTVRRKEKREDRDGGWFGVYIPGWEKMQNLPHEVTAARQYRFVTLELEQKAKNYPGRWFRHNYETLCENPRETVETISGQLQLGFFPKLEAALPFRGTESRNFKWRQQLDAKLIEQIRDEDREFFTRYEFDDESSQAATASAS